MSETIRAKRGWSPGYPVIIAALVLLGSVLVVNASFSSGTYSLEIPEVLADLERYTDRRVRIVGLIKEGSVSVVPVNGVQETRFTLHDGKGNELPVVYPHNPPDPFKEGRDCIAEGHVDEAGVLQCAQLIVKCPSKYQSEGDVQVDTSKPASYYRDKYGEADRNDPTF